METRGLMFIDSMKEEESEHSERLGLFFEKSLCREILLTCISIETEVSPEAEIAKRLKEQETRERAEIQNQ